MKKTSAKKHKKAGIEAARKSKIEPDDEVAEEIDGKDDEEDYDASPKDELETEEETKKPTADESIKGVKYLAMFLIAIVVLSLGAFFAVKYYNAKQLTKTEESYTYNYFQFDKKDGTWYTQAQEGSKLYQIALRYGPKELEDVKVKGNVSGLMKRWGFFYLTFDPTEKNFTDLTLANAEVSTKLVAHFNIGVASACTKPADVCDRWNLSIITCDNTTLPVIYFSQEPGPLVEIKGNCAIIQGKDEDIIKAADRFMYNMYGIMK
jgi:hypothetical protein